MLYTLNLFSAICQFYGCFCIVILFSLHACSGFSHPRDFSQFLVTEIVKIILLCNEGSKSFQSLVYKLDIDFPVSSPREARLILFSSVPFSRV